MITFFSGNTESDLDDDDDGEDSAHPLPIIIDRKRAPSGSKIPNPHRKRAATVSTRITKAKNEAKPLTISTMFVWECTKTALGRKDPGMSFMVKFGYSEKATKFEKIFHLKFDATQ